MNGKYEERMKLMEQSISSMENMLDQLTQVVIERGEAINKMLNILKKIEWKYLPLKDQELILKALDELTNTTSSYITLPDEDNNQHTEDENE
jgi:uncharacterized coiled-coil protein SlyX